MNQTPQSPADLLGPRSAESAAHPGTLTEVSSGARQQPEGVPSKRVSEGAVGSQRASVWHWLCSQARNNNTDLQYSAFLARMVCKWLRAELIEGSVLAVVANGALTSRHVLQLGKTLPATFAPVPENP